MRRQPSFLVPADPDLDLPVQVTKVDAFDIPPKMGEKVDLMRALREQRAALEVESAKAKAKYDQVEQALLEQLEDQGCASTGGATASASISESTVAQVIDWDTFYQYIKDHDYFHLLQRRVSDPSVRELFERDGAVPGVVPYIKRKIHLTAKKG
jgi:hypothetical protein